MLVRQFITRDHIVARVRGGTNFKDNIAWSCAICNALKSDMSAYEFRIFLSTVVWTHIAYDDYVKLDLTRPYDFVRILFRRIRKGKKYKQLSIFDIPEQGRTWDDFKSVIHSSDIDNSATRC